MDASSPIQIITDRSALDGTAYVELMGGAYANQCWNSGSLFFEEEVFGYLEPTIEKYVSAYDHYAFTQIAMHDWLRIVSALIDLRRSLETGTARAGALDQIGFFFSDSKSRFTENLGANSDALVALISHLETWTGENRLKHNCVTILGL